MALAVWKARQDRLAFGVVPAFRRYELYQARYAELVPVVAEHLRAGPVSVLDVGAGEGQARRFVEALAGKARWTAIEIDPRRAEVLGGQGYDEVVTSIDLERDRLPFGDGHFDVVIASHVLEHLSTAREAFDDWMRVLRPGGSMLLGVPMHPGWLAALARLRLRWLGRRPRGHCQFFSMRSLRRFLHGHEVKRIWGFRIFSARRQLPLEDWEWFYRASRWAGARLPSLAGEVIAHVVRR